MVQYRYTNAHVTSGQRILMTGRIAILSPLAAESGFVRPWPPSNTCLLGLSPVSPANSISIGSTIIAYSAAKSPNAFQWGEQPPKLPLPPGKSATPSNTWSFGQSNTAPQMACQSVQLLLQGSRTRPTDWTTDHATLCVAIGRHC